MLLVCFTVIKKQVKRVVCVGGGGGLERRGG